MRFKIQKFTFISLIIFSLCNSLLFAQAKTQEQIWVDSVYNSLNLNQRIAQLLVVRANQSGEGYFRNIQKYIKKYNIGGVTFFKNSPVKQALITNHWQSLSKTPLLISIDGEYGVGMRLDSIFKFPFQITLGAIQNDSLIYKMGKEIAWQCKRLGIQMNFAPVIDINVNPKNPVINSRSFGEDKYNVSRKGIMYMKGLQDEGIIATAKHFPGHGDTGSDSHHTLPIIKHNKIRLNDIELFPFKELIKQNLGGIMIAHLYIPAYEKGKNIASTLSPTIVTDLLKKDLNFKGLIVTDALDMKGVTKYFKSGVIEVKALQAGNDILLLPADVSKAIKKIRKAVGKGVLSKKLIEERCKKVLGYKYKAGLNNLKKIKIKNIVVDINHNRAKFLNRKLYEEALTIVKNQDSLLPLKRLDTLKIASLIIGNTEKGIFQKRLDLYANVDHFYTKSDITQKEQNKLFSQLKNYNAVIVGIQNTGISVRKKFGITSSAINFVNTLQKQNKIIFDLFANPYALAYFKTEQIHAVIVSYQDNYDTHDLSAQLIFGGIEAKGKLPVTINREYPLYTGIHTNKIRLAYTTPEYFGISKQDILKVDSIALHGIKEKAYPGCQVLAAKDGKVFYHKSFGKHTYLSKNKVDNMDIYDVASLTKIVASTISVMRLYENNVFDLDRPVSDYLHYLKGTNKENIILRDLLTHQAQFQAWIPYYRSTLNAKKKQDPDVYRNKISEKFPTRVAENLYIRRNYAYRIMDSIIISPLREKKDYKYSDLGFYVLARAIESICNMPLDEYTRLNFYNSLGLTTLGYLPREHFSLTRIIPTENDVEFRKQLLHGDVHDPGAAMLGGVCGHAGVFSNSNDLAVILQLMLNKGVYGGQKYFEKSTVEEFTRYQFPLNENRRGLGFDKPLLEYDAKGPNCKSASEKSYGHSGFTGTYMWADPKNNLIYIFLSNRVHPNASNPRIYKLDIRTNIHEAFYEALRNAK
jgi:beta-glucosidase-like glycosyl hydrolase/CubicO group peptidase (beta-lactamase class C family)